MCANTSRARSRSHDSLEGLLLTPLKSCFECSVCQSGVNALMLAVYHSRLSSVKLLLSHGANVEATAQVYRSYSLLSSPHCVIEWFECSAVCVFQGERGGGGGVVGLWC